MKILFIADIAKSPLEMQTSPCCCGIMIQKDTKKSLERIYMFNTVVCFVTCCCLEMADKKIHLVSFKKSHWQP